MATASEIAASNKATIKAIRAGTAAPGNNKDTASAFGLDFEQLLALELKALEHQDPLKPQDNAQLAAQIADISMIELQQKQNKGTETLVNLQKENSELMAQLTKLQSDLVTGIGDANGALNNLNEAQKNVLAQQGLTNLSTEQSLALSMIGKEYLVQTEQIDFNGVNPTTFSYAVSQDLKGPAQILIKDSSGNVVRTLTGVKGSGVHEITWDGKSSGGNKLPSGSYKVEVSGVTAEKSEAIDLAAYIYKRVNGVESGGVGNTMLVLEDGSKVTLEQGFAARV